MTVAPKAGFQQELHTVARNRQVLSKSTSNIKTTVRHQHPELTHHLMIISNIQIMISNIYFFQKYEICKDI